MSSYELGRVGIALLALYCLIQTVLGVADVVQSSSAHEDGPFVVRVAQALALALAIAIPLGGIPAWVLLRYKDGLARRWFSGGDASPNGLTAAQLLRVGLTLIGVSVVVAGATGVASALLHGGSLVFSEESIIRDQTVALAVAGGANATLQVLAGVLLIRLAKPLSIQWTE